MARMIPITGPLETDSYGEQRIYQLLKRGLPDDFIVIHSLPWLSSGVKEIDPSYPPTGEIDFIIIHESLGILALEVKGGIQRVEGSTFVYIKTGRSGNHVRQARKNAHGLAKWLGSDSHLRLRIGYGLIFPDSEFGEKFISPALIDLSIATPQAIFIDRLGMTSLAQRVREIMVYWKQANCTSSLGINRVTRLLEVLCPEFDGTPSWGSRVEYDNRTWLRLTEEQEAIVNTATTRARIVVTGWPGTGKTLIAVELARRMIADGKRVLALTFNALLADYLSSEIGGDVKCQVATWHGFCSGLARKVNGGHTSTQEWMDQGCMEDLRKAQELGHVPEFDVLLLDEAQTFKQEWCEWLAVRFKEKMVIAFCDETQLFSFEKERILTTELCEVFGVASPFALTISLRSPRIVLDHLLRIRPPFHQMHSPREVEADTLQERVVADMEKALDQAIGELEAQGIARGNIVVLSKFVPARDNLDAERYETVTRFRGMEASAIIIVWADTMDDVELFCAYSRATTVCIALFEAENLGCKETGGKFKELVLASPDNAKIANDARKQGLTSYLIFQHVESVAIGLVSARLAWCDVWNCWLVDREDDSEAAHLWIDYLVAHHPWSVYSWTSESRRKIVRSNPVANIVEDFQGATSHEIFWCAICEGVTPHERQIRGGYICQRCARAAVQRNAPSRELIADLQKFDAIICSPNPKMIPQQLIEQLPLSLAALGARKFAQGRPRQQSAKLGQLPTGGVLYRAAMAFVFSRISLLQAGTEIGRDQLALESGRFILPTGVTREQWRLKIAQSLGKGVALGLLKKRSAGIYSTMPLSTAED